MERVSYLFKSFRVSQSLGKSHAGVGGLAGLVVEYMRGRRKICSHKVRRRYTTWENPVILHFAKTQQCTWGQCPHMPLHLFSAYMCKTTSLPKTLLSSTEYRSTCHIASAWCNVESTSAPSPLSLNECEGKNVSFGPVAAHRGSCLKLTAIQNTPTVSARSFKIPMHCFWVPQSQRPPLMF